MSKIIIDENFQTPIDVCEYMVGLIPKNVLTVLEPTPGLGNLKYCVLNKGYQVYSPDDFFLMNKSEFDCVIMNPPFSSNQTVLDNAPSGINLSGLRAGYYILEKCMEMSDNVIALMPWFTIGDSDVRMRRFKEFGLASVTLLPRKTFKYARIQTVVLQLQKGYNKKSEFKTL